MDYNEWLVEHQELINYVSLNARPKNLNTKKKLNKYYNEIVQAIKDVILKDPIQVLVRPQPKPLYLGGEAAMMYHKKIFIKEKLNNIALNNHNQLSGYLADVLSLLSDGKITISIPDNLYLEVDYDSLIKKYSNAQDKHWNMLKAKLEEYEAKIDESNKFVETQSDQKQFFCARIEESLMEFDPNSSFLKRISTQDELEVLFEYPEFPLHNKFVSVVQGYSSAPKDFIPNLISLVYVTLNHFDFHETNSENVLILFLFRYAFDKLYAFQKSPLNRNPFDLNKLKTVDPLIHYLSNCTFQQLKPPDECCPKHTPDMKVSEVFRNDPDYYPAVLALEEIIFHTNPIDSLNAVHDCLHEIELAVNKIHPTKEAMLPFEVTFGVFLCVASASHIPELQNISDFIDECVPKTGLSPVFDFAHTKLKAATYHLRQIVKMQQQ
ncbi:hypothetical protein M9Y10_004727 [Tritrichomonas musculus]|uniref:VPS9 domain-containing protein n=1 Tax=Tritrichomonas musculus TaxID=1915356 RepID=A0ABR2JJW7_9EUKA